MSKQNYSVTIDDISVFARTLSHEFTSSDGAPSYVRLLNVIAKAGGYKNYQHLKAESDRVAKEPPQNVNEKSVVRATATFDDKGIWVRWPAKRALQLLGLWVMWSQLPANTVMTEKDVNAHLNSAHQFGDPATLRRELVGLELLTRDLDGSNYRRVEKQPSAEARVLISNIKKMRKVVAVNPNSLAARHAYEARYGTPRV